MFPRFKTRWNRFCDTSTIHGVRHISLRGEETAAAAKCKYTSCLVFKKLLWFFVLAGMIFVFILNVEQNYKRFLKGNTLARSYKIYLNDTKFPTILFCPQALCITNDYLNDTTKWIGKFFQKFLGLTYINNKTRKEYYRELQMRKVDSINMMRCTIEEQKCRNEKYYRENSTSLACECIARNGTNIAGCKEQEDDLIKGGDLNKLLEATMKEFVDFVQIDYNVNLTKLLLEEVLIELLKEINFVKFKENPVNASVLFRKVLTRLGYCFKFNLDYANDLGGIEKLIYNGGVKNGLNVALVLHKDYFKAENPFSFNDGMRVIILPKDEDDMEELVESFENAWQVVPYASQVNMAFHLKDTYLLPTSRGMKEYISCVDETKKEKTFLDYLDLTNMLLEDSNPPDLKYFKSYSMKKCNFECIIDHVIKEFDCVPLYVKPYPIYPNTSTCSLMLEALIENYIQAISSLDKFCSHCKPLCHTSEYSIEMSHFKYDNHKFRHEICIAQVGDRPDASEICKGITFFNFYFKDLSRDIQAEEFDFNFRDFMTSLGGYIGLFLGASLISVLELLTFFASLMVPISKVNQINPQK